MYRWERWAISPIQFVNRNVFATTENELKLIAAAAIIGFKKKLKNGSQYPRCDRHT